MCPPQLIKACGRVALLGHSLPAPLCQWRQCEDTVAGRGASLWPPPAQRAQSPLCWPAGVTMEAGHMISE